MTASRIHTPAPWIAALGLLLAIPFAATQAATKFLESSPGSGFVISADFEDLSADGAITRKGGQFVLGRPADREEHALLEWLGSNVVTGSGIVDSLTLLDRMRWGDVTLFRVARPGYPREHATLPVRCANTCTASFSMDGYAGIPDPEFWLSTFFYFREERARILAAELPRTRSFPVAVKVLPENLDPAHAFPITFQVDVHLAFAGNTSPAVYDFESRAWRGKTTTNEAEWQALVRFLTGLRKATPDHVGDYLDEQFADKSARQFMYELNDFESRNGTVKVSSPLLEPDDFAARVADFQAIVPLGTVQDGPAVRLLFATSPSIEDVQQMPIRCASSGCRVAPEDWINYVTGAIQQPVLLRRYLAMFRKAAAGGAAPR